MKSKKWLIGILLAGLALVGLSFLQLGDNLVYFYTPAEAVTKAPELSKKDIRVGAMVKAGSVKWDDSKLNLSFVMSDLDKTEISVTHRGTAPDMFKEGQGVVVEGRISNDGTKMVSKNLFVKHSEEYKQPGDTSSMNMDYLQKSLFKNEKEGS